MKRIQFQAQASQAVLVVPLALALGLGAGLAGCGAQVPDGVDDSQSVEVKSPKVAPAERHDTSPPLMIMRLSNTELEAEESEVEHEHPVKKLPRPDSAAANRGRTDRALQATFPALLTAPAPLTSFDGLGAGFTGPAGTFSVNSAPPDTNGDIGPNHYVQVVNSELAIFNKTGTVLYGPVALNTLWSGFGGGCQTNNDGDPIVLYDPISNRWVISQFSVSTTPYLQCVAVSQTGDPTGQYYRYSFSYSTNFNDYPKMGVWPDAYYFTFNMFNSAGTAFLGGKVCAYDRAKMLTGAAATQQCFDTGTSIGGLLPADLDGTTLPPAGSPEYVLALGASANQLAFYKFHVDWTTPANSTFTGPTNLATSSFTEACGTSGTCIPQSGGGQLDSLSDRLMFRLAYRNFGDHEAMVTNHSIVAGSSVGVRWYELRVANGTPSIFQQGTYAPDSNYRWMGSAAFDKSGNIGLGFSLSGSALKPQVHYTGRLVGDAAGTMGQGENTLIDGAGAQGSSLTRWGDYSMLGVDPTDDCTFWFTTEYLAANGTFNWHTRIGSFKFPSCGGTVTNDFSMSASPATVSVVQGANGTSTISTAITSGVAQTVALTASGAPAGVTASFSPSSVSSGGSSTLTLAVGASTATGTYAITVTGTGASATHTTTVNLTVTAPVANDFSIAASPASVSVVQGANGTSSISTAVTSGVAQTVALSASGVPAGTTASFSPTSVTAGSGSTLTLAVGASTATGTYAITVTGTGASATHTTTVNLTVTAPAANDFSIAVSPTSGSIQQGATGTATVSAALVSGSAQTVTFSASGLPAGVTASFSPASVSTGASSTLTLTVASSAATGTSSITITGTAASGSKTATYALTVTAASGGPTVLTNGVAVTGLAGATGAQSFFVISVPTGQSSLVFNLSGGTGDADMYVQQGTQPTLTTYACRPYVSGNTETCTFTNPVAGNWYVMLNGYTAYSGVSLKGTYTAPAPDTTPVLTNGVTVTNISGASGSAQYWKLTVPAGQAKVVFTMSGQTGTTGDADLYVRKGSKPTTSTYDCRPYLTGNNETCTITSPTAADYYVMIRGYTAFTAVSLKGQYP